MKNSRSIFFIVGALAVLCTTEVFGQNKKIDSLKIVLKTSKEDTNKLNALIDLSWKLTGINADTSIIIANQALALSEKLDNPKKAGSSYHVIARAYYVQGNFPLALENNFKALRIREKINDQKGISGSLTNIGMIYQYQGLFTKALVFYFRAIDIPEVQGNKKLRAQILTNIGVVYRNQGDSSLVKGNRKYAVDEKYSKALESYFSALNLCEEINDKHGIAIILGDIGNVYFSQDDFPNALEYYSKSLKVREELGIKDLISSALRNLGSLYARTGKMGLAEDCYKQSLELAEHVGSLDNISEAEKALSELYEKTGRTALAFAHYKKYILTRDSITNEENTKAQTRTEMQYDFDKKTTADSIKNSESKKRDDLRHEQEIQQQKMYTYGGVVGFLLMIVVAVISIRAFKNKEKANKIISHQKLLVEEKQKEILDSIHYAKRIQKSLLPTETYLERSLKRLKKERG